MISYEDFYSSLNEMSLNNIKIRNRIKGIFNQTNIFSLILDQTKEEIEKIKNYIRDIEIDEFNLIKNLNDEYNEYYIVYPSYVKTSFDSFEDVLKNQQNLSFEQLEHIRKILYGENRRLNTDNIRVTIEKNNFNKIHILYGIPPTFMELGLGKKILLKIIDEVGYISTLNDENLSFEFARVWTSIASKNENIYTFQSDSKIISFSSKIKHSKIEKIIKKFFQNEKYDLDDEYEKESV